MKMLRCLRKVCGLVTLVCVFALFAWVSSAIAEDTYVRGYYRKDGTYVAPHYRSAPDRSYNNNWSTSPNVNPYTGKRGTRSPTWDDRLPSQGNDLYDFGGDRPSSQWDTR